MRSLLLSVSLGWVLHASSASAVPTDMVSEEIRNQVVMICSSASVEECNGNLKTPGGAGFVIGTSGLKTYVVTAHHVVAKLEVFVKFLGMKHYVPAQRSWRSPKDLAVLAVSTSLLRAAGIDLESLTTPVARHALRQDDDVLLVGRPGVSEWKISGTHPVKLPDGDHFRITDPVSKGMSGAPVLNLCSQIVGIVLQDGFYSGPRLRLVQTQIGTWLESPAAPPNYKSLLEPREPCGRLPPDPPGNLKFHYVDFSEILLQWGNATNVDSFEITRYHISQRGVSTTKTWRVLDCGADLICRESETDLEPGETYKYEIRATNAGGESLPSTPLLEVPMFPQIRLSVPDEVLDNSAGQPARTSRRKVPFEVEVKPDVDERLVVRLNQTEVEDETVTLVLRKGRTDYTARAFVGDLELEAARATLTLTYIPDNWRVAWRDRPLVVSHQPDVEVAFEMPNDGTIEAWSSEGFEKDGCHNEDTLYSCRLEIPELGTRTVRVRAKALNGTERSDDLTIHRVSTHAAIGLGRDHRSRRQLECEEANALALVPNPFLDRCGCLAAEFSATRSYLGGFASAPQGFQCLSYSPSPPSEAAGPAIELKVSRETTMGSKTAAAARLRIYDPRLQSLALPRPFADGKVVGLENRDLVWAVELSPGIRNRVGAFRLEGESTAPFLIEDDDTLIYGHHDAKGGLRGHSPPLQLTDLHDWSLIPATSDRAAIIYVADRQRTLGYASLSETPDHRVLLSGSQLTAQALRMGEDSLVLAGSFVDQIVPLGQHDRALVCGSHICAFYVIFEHGRRSSFPALLRLGSIAEGLEAGPVIDIEEGFLVSGMAVPAPGAGDAVAVFSDGRTYQDAASALLASISKQGELQWVTVAPESGVPVKFSPAPDGEVYLMSRPDHEDDLLSVHRYRLAAPAAAPSPAPPPASPPAPAPQDS